MTEKVLQPTSEEQINRITARLSETLSERRKKHTFFVEKEALALAETLVLVYNIDDAFKNDLRAAALLHDITKELSLTEQLSLCRTHGIDPGKYPSGAILHGHTAAFVGRAELGINDRVFSAVYCHTTGSASMSVMDKLLFLADYIEPSRTHAACKRTRAYYYSQLEARGAKEALQVLDETTLLCLEGTLAHLLEKGNLIDLETVKARNALVAQNVCIRTTIPRGTDT